MQRVLVLGKSRQPLMPCHPARARRLLREGKAAVFRRFPFTIILKEREDGITQPTALKLDPGSRTTGLALVSYFARRGNVVVWAAELQHRGSAISKALYERKAHRSLRRSKLRYRPARFLNRSKLKGWLAPSLQHRVYTTMTWVNRMRRLAPIMCLSQELVSFDTQSLQTPEISGAEYQRGTLFGYDVREYLLEKWGRECAYCGSKNVPLTIDHIHPRSKGGSNRVSNLTLACSTCNQRKGNIDVAEFLSHDPLKLARIEKQRKATLRDAAVVNSTRWALWRALVSTGLAVEVGSGSRTKYNRNQHQYPKAHWIDAACVGESGADVHLNPQYSPLCIEAKGHGKRRMQNHDSYGFPKGKAKSKKRFYFGFQTGDLVCAIVTYGSKTGKHVGRVLCRASGIFDIQTKQGRVSGISRRYCHPIHRMDGYSYVF